MSTSSELATRVVELVRRAAPGAEAEVVAEESTQALTRFANSYIHQNVADATSSLRLRVHLDGRTAAGSTTVVGEDGLAALVERTLSAARLCPPDPAWPGLAPVRALSSVDAWDGATAEASPAERAERVRAFVDATEGAETAGMCRTIRWEAAFANSAGQTVEGRCTEAALDGIARRGGSDGLARVASRRLADLDGHLLGRRAGVKARLAADPVELPPGRYEVVLEPAAVADLLANLAFYGFNGKAHNERQSFAELGRPQFDPAVTIVDDIAATAGLGLPFDSEGTPKPRLTLVDGGVTAAVAHDRRSAAEAGTESTGHGFPGSGSWGPIATNLRFEPVAADGSAAADGSDAAAAPAGGPAANADAASLVSQVSRGLLVTDFWYTRVLDPKTLAVTGLTRNGVWLIEDGEIRSAVQNFRFTQAYPQALAPGGVLGVGRHVETAPDGWGPSGFTGPALRLASWNFTGGASG
jgi:predicted Zn-dependent protease